jgi:2'-5' RNA ligase
MDGIISLLDTEHERRVRAIWRELESDFGLLRVRQIVPFPHITYQGAGRFEEQRIGPMLERIARDAQPFTVRTAGLGIFTGAVPVLTITVVRDAALDAFHRHVWDTVGDAASDFAPYYAPGDRWMPHITLAQYDLTCENLPPVVAALCGRDFEWDIQIDHLALLVEDVGLHTYGIRRYEFGAGK